jgi:hypothetical protein
MFQCIVKEGGQEPLFFLRRGRRILGVYKRTQLDAALERWREVAAEA